ncbi:hypothetical protein FKM82_001787 [Ascaphus truei]
MSMLDTGGLPYEFTFVFGKPYLVTTNVDVSNGLANGALGSLVYIQCNEDSQVQRLWLEFLTSPKVGKTTSGKDGSQESCYFHQALSCDTSKTNLQHITKQRQNNHS